MATPEILLLANGNVIELTGLRNSVTGDYENEADVEVTLRNAYGESVSGESWPLSMDHVEEDPDQGKYQATMSASLDLVADRPYLAVVDATAVGVEPGHWEIPVSAQVRSS